jgi:hypothetical protein
MYQNVGKNSTNIIGNNTGPDNWYLTRKVPTFYITNQFCRVRLIECLLYFKKWDKFVIISFNLFSDKFSNSDTLF